MAKIFVICGHGAGDSGAVGNGYTEAERVRALGKRIKELGGSSVMLGDVNRNYYADKGISSLTISKDYQIVELHMDSASASAKGGHVIIKDGLEPDKYDEALAKMLKEILPGRSQMIVKRSDLANPKRAAAKGYGYRLVEFGFISNSGDVKIFNTRMDDIAKGVLESFGIKASGSSASSGSSGNSTSKPSTSKPSTSKPSTSKPSTSDDVEVDGLWGKDTTKKSQKVFKTTVDGIVSNQYDDYKNDNPELLSSSWEWESNPGKNGSELIKAIQKKVNDTVKAGLKIDGFIGPKTIKGIQKFLNAAIKAGLKVDGFMGPKSIKAYQTWLNKQ